MALENTDKFNLKAVYEYFNDSIHENDDVLLKEYLNSYRELNKFFNLMGTIFGFVSSDLQSKIDILAALSIQEINHFQSVKIMIEYEKEHHLLDKKGYTSGSRTLLRLHRGLDFIREFLQKVGALENSANTASACREAYNGTLARHHSFVIRNGAKAAMYALPTRENLLLKVCGSADQVETTIRTLPKTLETIALVYDRIDTLYTIHDLHALP